MKLSMFTTTESYVAWLKGEIEAIEQNGLASAKKMYELALKGEGKEEWMRLNKTNCDEAWYQHLLWMKDQIKYLERKVRKYQREVATYGN